MKKIWIKISNSLLCFIIAILPFVVGISKVTAQAYRGLIIDEVIFDLETVNPGDSIEKSFTVTHDFQDEDYEVTVYLHSKDFTASDKPGVPLFLNKSQVPEASRLSDWIEFEQESISLDHRGQVETINFTINVPNDAEPGGKYAAILLSNLSGDLAVEDLNGPGFGLNSELGPLVLLTVNGNLIRDLQIKDIYTTNAKGKRQSFFFNPPVNVVVEFENTGNVHVAPVGRVYVHKGDNFQQYYATYELNPNQSYILPGTTRTYTYTWDDSFISTQKISQGDIDGDGDEDFTYPTKYDWDKLSKLRLGNYTASVQFAYTRVDGTSANPPINKVSFLIIPWQLLALIGIIVFLILLIMWVKVLKDERKHKRNKKHHENHFR